MRNITLKDVIDLEAIEATAFDDSVENDVFYVVVKDGEYWVYFNLVSPNKIYLGASFTAYGAREIMESFVWGCFYTTVRITKYDLEEQK